MINPRPTQQLTPLSDHFNSTGTFTPEPLPSFLRPVSQRPESPHALNSLQDRLDSQEPSGVNQEHPPMQASQFYPQPDLHPSAPSVSTERRDNSRSSVNLTRRTLIDAQQHIMRSFHRIQRPQVRISTTQNEYPGISVVEPSHPNSVLTVQEFMDLRMARLHKMIEYIDELGLYFGFHALVVLVVTLRLLFEDEPPFEYGVALFIPFYLYKLVVSITKCARASQRRGRCYFSIQIINDLFYIMGSTFLLLKTYRGRGFPIMSYCGPFIMACGLRFIKFKKESTPCGSLLQLFKTMGVVFRLSLILTISIKFDDLMNWSWASTFWPLWCSFAIQGVMILFTLVLLLWSLTMLCRRIYPFKFLIGALWAFFVTYGFSITSSWFILNLAVILENQDHQSLHNRNLLTARYASILLAYLVLACLFTFLGRKQLPFWFERMLYTPAQIDNTSNQNPLAEAPSIKEKRYVTPKFITKITSAYFRKSKASERKKAESTIRIKNRIAILNNTRPSKRIDDDHHTSVSAGILMSSSHDILPKLPFKFKNSELTESIHQGSLRPVGMIRNESSFSKQTKVNSQKNQTPIRFSYTLTGEPRQKKLRNVVSFFKKDNNHRKAKDKRVGVSNHEDINKLKNQECCVCLANPPNCVLMECGHGSLCFPCGETLLRNNQVCPLCRLDIKAVLEIDLISSEEKTLKVLRSLFREDKERKSQFFSSQEATEITEAVRTPGMRRSLQSMGDKSAGKKENQEEDPFEIFSFRNRKNSEEIKEEEDIESFEDWKKGELSPNNNKSILDDLEKDLKEFKDVKATTIVGLKRLFFFDQEELQN